MSTAAVFPSAPPSALTDCVLQKLTTRMTRHDQYQKAYILGGIGIGVLGVLATKVSSVAACCFITLSLVFVAFNNRFSNWMNTRKLNLYTTIATLEKLSADQKIAEGLGPIIQRSSTLQKLSSVYTSPPAAGASLATQAACIMEVMTQLMRNDQTIPSFDANTLQSEVHELNNWVCTWDQRPNKKPSENTTPSALLRSSLTDIKPHDSDPKKVAETCFRFMWVFSNFQGKIETMHKELSSKINS